MEKNIKNDILWATIAILVVITIMFAALLANLKTVRDQNDHIITLLETRSPCESVNK